MKLKGLWLVTVDSQSLRVLVMTNLIGHLLIVNDIHCVKVRLSYTSSDMTGQYLPDDVNVTLRTGNNTSWHMHLRHVKYKSRDIPLYTVQVSEDGEHVRKRLDVKIRQNTGFYRDQSQLSLVKITRTNDVMDTMALLKMKGHIFLTGSLYYLAPQARDGRVATSGSATSDDHLYVLEMIKTPPFPNMNDSVVHNSVSTLPFPGTPNNITARRPVRQASGTYLIDVAVLVDYVGYQQFNKHDGSRADQALLEYTAFVMAEVDEIYQTITTAPFKIRVSLIRVIVMKSAGSSPFTDQHVAPGSRNILNVENSLKAFNDYIIGDGRDVIGKHDHVMLFSGYDLAGVKGGSLDQNVAGLAPLSSLCLTTGKSSSVVEILTENYAPVTAAHELGHNLGAAHDGEGNTCLFQDRFIMAASSSKETPATKLNPWRFSSCSIESFQTYLTNAITTPTVLDCLTGSLAIDATVPSVTGRFLGQEVSLDKQCERSFGTGAFFCRTKDIVYADLCGGTMCRKPGTTTCISMPVARGTTCGNGKLCIRGDCVKHEKAPQVDDKCVFGDAPGTVTNNMKCGEYINVNSGACYDGTFLAYCCDLCKQRYRAITGCEYGDKTTGCTPDHCSVIANIPICCSTCNPEAGKPDNPPPDSGAVTTRKPEEPQGPPDGERITQKNENTPAVSPVTEKRFEPSPGPPDGATDVWLYLFYSMPLVISIGGMILTFVCYRQSRRRALAAAAAARKATEAGEDYNDDALPDEYDVERLAAPTISKSSAVSKSGSRGSRRFKSITHSTYSNDEGEDDEDDDDDEEDTGTHRTQRLQSAV